MAEFLGTVVGFGIICVMLGLVLAVAGKYYELLTEDLGINDFVFGGWALAVFCSIALTLFTIAGIVGVIGGLVLLF